MMQITTFAQLSSRCDGKVFLSIRFVSGWEELLRPIHIKRLLAALQRFGLPDHYLRMLELIYSKMSFFVTESANSAKVVN